MLRMLSLALLVSPALANAQVPPAPEAPPSPPVTDVAPAEEAPAVDLEPVDPAAPAEPAPPAQAAPPAETVAPVEAEVVPEEPKMKKVCHTEDVVGSAFPRRICRMKPVRPN